MNWKAKNAKYIREGLLYLDFGFLGKWKSEIRGLNRRKEGARYKYPVSLIRFCSVLKIVFRLGYRQQQGFLQGLQKWVPIPEIPDYTQLQRRMTKLGFDLVKGLSGLGDRQIIAIDSTGIKLYNSGEWIREKHKKRKPFLKLHIAVNIKTKQAVSYEITDDSVHDSKVALKLVDKARKVKKIAKALMDGAYDTYDIWKGLTVRAIKPVVKLRKNAVVNTKKSPSRSQAVKCYIGNEDEWKKANQYGQRWQSETWYSVFKTRFGEYVYSKKPENVLHELLMKICLCNKLIV